MPDLTVDDVLAMIRRRRDAAHESQKIFSGTELKARLWCVENELSHLEDEVIYARTAKGDADA